MQTSFELTPKQAEYIRNANHRWNVACGAVRSGKSYCQISYCIPQRLAERKGLRGLRVILGATRDNIERNILQPMRELFGDSIATEINSKNTCKILGEKVYCIGTDKISQVPKIRGSEIAYCAIDEAIDMNKEVFEMLKSRLSLPWSCCDITTNPGSPNHWFKAFLDSKDVGVDIYYLQYTLYDNPFLPEDYVKNLEIEYAGSVWFKRYILGEWALAEGLVYPNYAKALYGMEPAEPIEEYVISLDYGTSNPFAAILWGRRGDTWYGLKEIYYSGRDTGVQKTDDEYLTMLENFIDPLKESMVHTGTNMWGVTETVVDRIPVIVDPSAASFIALLRQSEYFKPRNAINDVKKGLSNTFSAIERGIIKINKTLCPAWIKEARGYVWDLTKTEDAPIKVNDHLMDATGYFVNTKNLLRGNSNYSPVLGG